MDDHKINFRTNLNQKEVEEGTHDVYHRMGVKDEGSKKNDLPIDNVLLKKDDLEGVALSRIMVFLNKRVMDMVVVLI